MPKKSFKPSHIEKRYNTYFAVLTIPKDVRPILGKSKFFETTGTGNLKVAESLAALKVIKWQYEIDNARNPSEDPILNSAQELNRLLKTSPRHQVEEIIEEEESRIRDASGEFVSDIFASVAKGKSKVLKELISGWREYQNRKGLQEKTIEQMERDIKSIIEFLPTSALLNKTNINAWFKYISKDKKLTAPSVTRIYGAGRNFFEYLKVIEEISSEVLNPFVVPNEFKVSKKSNSKAIYKREKRKEFTVVDIEKLHKASISKGDQSLADLIFIAAYTGARIEEICSLRQTDINLKKKSLTIEDSKTEAGKREIPIHSKLFPKIKELMDKKGEYLIPNLTFNKYQDRSNAIGKRFSSLKTKLGYGKNFVFHSIRKTFSTELDNAGVFEPTAAKILGHKIQTMSYGVYSGGANLEVMRKAISKISFNLELKNTTEQSKKKTPIKNAKSKIPEKSTPTKKTMRKTTSNIKKDT